MGALIHAGHNYSQPALKRAPWLLLRDMLSEGGAHCTQRSTVIAACGELEAGRPPPKPTARISCTGSPATWDALRHCVGKGVLERSAERSWHRRQQQQGRAGGVSTATGEQQHGVSGGWRMSKSYRPAGACS